MQVMSHACVANYDNGNNYACDNAEHDDHSAENKASRHCKFNYAMIISPKVTTKVYLFTLRIDVGRGTGQLCAGGSCLGGGSALP